MTDSESQMKALMLRALDGDAAAYRRLLEGLRVRLDVYFGRRLRADPAQCEDLVQDTLIAVHAAGHLRPRPAADGMGLRHRRLQARRPLPPVGSAPLHPHRRRRRAARRGREHAAEARHDLGRGLAGLPERTRDLVVNVKLHEESIADVARRTGMSESAVKVAVHRGFRKLSARLRGAAASEGGDGPP